MTVSGVSLRKRGSLELQPPLGIIPVPQGMVGSRSVNWEGYRNERHRFAEAAELFNPLPVQLEEGVSDWSDR
jgi:hypothetical protein